MPKGQFAVTLGDEAYFRVQIPKGIIALLNLSPGDKIEVCIEKVER
jgi:bifunctional DNA-binding transcriptional regulator/antitoxin component of YhaV-PrlF toxin-antitoxin module